MDNFENSYAFNDENALKAILRDNDNPLIFNTHKQWLFLLNKNLEQNKLLNDEILVELKKKIEAISNQDNLFWNLNLIQGEKMNLKHIMMEFNKMLDKAEFDLKIELEAHEWLMNQLKIELIKAKNSSDTQAINFIEEKMNFQNLMIKMTKEEIDLLS